MHTCRILSSLPQAVDRYVTFMVLAAIPSGEHKKIPTCDIDLVSRQQVWGSWGPIQTVD